MFSYILLSSTRTKPSLMKSSAYLLEQTALRLSNLESLMVFSEAQQLTMSLKALPILVISLILQLWCQNKSKRGKLTNPLSFISSIYSPPIFLYLLKLIQSLELQIQSINFHQMSKLQQEIFLNLSRHSRYNSRSRYISESYAYFTRNRDQQIQNEFELVDFEGKGRISRQDLLEHMTQKHGELDMQTIDEVFSTMSWDYRGEVSKSEFCKKYLAKEKQLYSEANRYSSLRKKVETTRQIFNQTKKLKPALYAVINIEKVFIKSDDPYLQQEDMMSLQVEYEDHKNKLEYLIQQPVYGADQPSFELLLPVQERYFFVRYKFINPKSKTREPFGQCYVNYPIADIIRSNQYGPNAVKKVNSVRSDITKNNQVKGYCEFTLVFESDVGYDSMQLNVVEKKIQEEEKELYHSTNLSEQKQKDYEYMQYLWGIRHKYPHKIAREDVKWMIVTRLVLACLLGVLSTAVHCLGRCEPLSFILALMILKNWKYVILRSEKFLMTWIAVVAACLDVIWLSFASESMSMINFLHLVSASVFTYILLVAKIVFVLYMIIIQKSLSSGHQPQAEPQK